MAVGGRRFGRAVVVFLAIGSAAVPHPVQAVEGLGEGPAVFDGAAGSEVPASGFVDMGATVRSRVDTVAPAGFDGLLSGAPTLVWNLFPDAVLVADVSGYEPQADRSAAWFGVVRGDPSSQVVAVIDRGRLTATVTTPAASFRVQWLEGDRHLVAEVDPVWRGEGPGDALEAARRGRQDAAPPSEERAASVVDVLVVWTPAAQGGATAQQMRLMAEQGVATANAAFTGSGIALRVRLAGARRIAGTETAAGLKAMLEEELVWPFDTKWDEAHLWREQYGADVVVMVVDMPAAEGCGISYQLGDRPIPGAAFAIVKRDCFAPPGNSFVHELGHVFGAGHAATQTVDPGPGARPYAAGWQVCPGLHWRKGYAEADRFTTVMAYQAPCDAVTPRANQFSSPWRRVNDIVAGNAETADNARRVQQTRGWVARYDSAGPELLFYDRESIANPGFGDAAFYDVAGEGSLLYIKATNQYRATWDMVIPLDLSGDGDDELLFYDSAAGEAAFYDVLGSGGLVLLRTATYRTGWDMIVPFDLDGNGDAEVLFYDRESTSSIHGDGDVYDLSPTGGLTPIKKSNLYRDGWDMIVPLDYDGDGDDELLFYDTTGTDAGFGDTGLYHVLPGGGLELIRASHRVRDGWDHIVPVDIGADGGEELLFYDATGRHAGYGEVFTYDLRADGSLAYLWGTRRWRDDWVLFAPVDVDSDGAHELVTYARTSRYVAGAGERSLWVIADQGSLHRSRSSSKLRAGWDVITPVRMPG